MGCTVGGGIDRCVEGVLPSDAVELNSDATFVFLMLLLLSASISMKGLNGRIGVSISMSSCLLSIGDSGAYNHVNRKLVVSLI